MKKLIIALLLGLLPLSVMAAGGGMKNLKVDINLENKSFRACTPMSASLPPTKRDYRGT